MIGQSGFTDLRMSHAHRVANEDSVWPSFTDIMTVIVMIFLMALVIILIRNVDLVQQLRETMTSERQVAELARTKEAQRQVLEGELAETRERLSTTESRLTEASTSLESARSTIESTTEQLKQTETVRDIAERDRTLLQERVVTLLRDIGALQTLKDRLSSEKLAATEENTRLGVNLESIRKELEAVRSERESLAADVSELTQNTVELTAIRERLARQLAESLGTISGLESDRQTVSEANIRLEDQLASLNESYAEAVKTTNTAKSRIAVLDEELDTVKTRYALSLEQLEMLEADLEQRERRLGEQQEQLNKAEQQVVALKGDYVDLEDKYQKLLRPARSPEGRYAVDVRYTTQSGVNLYQIREPGESEYRSVNLAQLYARLDEITERHPNNVYTRIIIPDDSGLSYNDAWKFTNDILSRYDYYNQ